MILLFLLLFVVNCFTLYKIFKLQLWTEAMHEQDYKAISAAWDAWEQARVDDYYEGVTR